MSTQSDYSVNLMKSLRKSFGWSQGELANRSEVSAHVVANLESRRKVDMTLDELILIADAFGVSPGFLLGSPSKADRSRLGERVMDELAAVLK